MSYCSLYKIQTYDVHKALCDLDPIFFCHLILPRLSQCVQDQKLAMPFCEGLDGNILDFAGYILCLLHIFLRLSLFKTLFKNGKTIFSAPATEKQAGGLTSLAVHSLQPLL